MARFLRFRSTNIGSLFVPKPLNFIEGKLNRVGKEIDAANSDIASNAKYDSLNYIPFASKDAEVAHNYYNKIDEGISKAADYLSPDKMSFNNYNENISNATNEIMRVKELKRRAKVQGTPEYQIGQNFKDFTELEKTIRKDKNLTSKEKEAKILGYRNSYINSGQVSNDGNLNGYGKYTAPSDYKITSFLTDMKTIREDQTAWANVTGKDAEWLTSSGGTTRQRTLTKLVSGGVSLARGNEDLKDRMRYRAEAYSHNIKPEYRAAWLKRENDIIDNGGIDPVKYNAAVKRYGEGKIPASIYPSLIAENSLMGSLVLGNANALTSKINTYRKNIKLNSAWDLGTDKLKNQHFADEGNSIAINTTSINNDNLSKASSFYTKGASSGVTPASALLAAQGIVSQVYGGKTKEAIDYMNKNFGKQVNIKAMSLGITPDEAASLMLANNDYGDGKIGKYGRANWFEKTYLSTKSIRVEHSKKNPGRYTDRYVSMTDDYDKVQKDLGNLSVKGNLKESRGNVLGTDDKSTFTGYKPIISLDGKGAYSTFLNSVTRNNPVFKDSDGNTYDGKDVKAPVIITGENEAYIAGSVTVPRTDGVKGTKEIIVHGKALNNGDLRIAGKALVEDSKVLISTKDEYKVDKNATPQAFITYGKGLTVLGLDAISGNASYSSLLNSTPDPTGNPENIQPVTINKLTYKLSVKGINNKGAKKLWLFSSDGKRKEVSTDEFAIMVGKNNYPKDIK